MVGRRDVLKAIGGTFAAGVFAGVGAGEDRRGSARTGMGLVTYCCRYRRELLRKRDTTNDLYDPVRFLQHCRALGAGGMQCRLGIQDPKSAGVLRKRAEEAGMYIEGIVSLPFEKKEVDLFTVEMGTAKHAGAKAVRTVIIPGRRYERFKTLKEFNEFLARGRKALELAAPVAEKFKLPLAVENHKDQRSDARVKLFKQIGSEYVGACVDTGNSMALLEDPVETATRLAPYAYSVHLKDQAVREYEDGFLLADVPLGQGAVDLKKVVSVLRVKKPGVHFSLELITRDPLKVPCLTERYWQPMPPIAGRDLARMLRDVRKHAAKTLPTVESLPLEKQVAQEDANVRASLRYAREVLRL